MNREQAKALLPIIAAYAEGKDIQKQDIVGRWYTLADPMFQADVGRYRIKPNPFKVYCNVYSQSTGAVVLEKDDLITTTRDRQGYLTVIWENGQFKSVEFTKV